MNSTLLPNRLLPSVPAASQSASSFPRLAFLHVSRSLGIRHRHLNVCLPRILHSLHHSCHDGKSSIILLTHPLTMKQDKEEFFSKLYALQNDSDDEEVDTNDARKVLKESAQPLSASASTSASFPVTSQPSRFRRSQPSNMPKKMPTMQHAASAPLPSSAVRDTPTLPRKPSKLRHNQSSTPDVVQPSSSGETTGARSTLAPQRSASTPNPVFGPPLVFKHSTGIDSMLKKNTTGMEKKLTAAQKRKRDRDDKLVMKPESERIFAGKTFVFVPNDNNSAYRAARIKDVRERGGVWAREVSKICIAGYDFVLFICFIPSTFHTTIRFAQGSTESLPRRGSPPFQHGSILAPSECPYFSALPFFLFRRDLC